MKILFVTSLYSALKQSIFTNRWQPTGMPAITNLYKKLFSMDYKFDNIYIYNSSNNNTLNILKNKRFNNTKLILGLSNLYKIKFLKHLKNIFNLIVILRNVHTKINEKKYNLIYVDRANLLVGAFLAHLGYNVVLRLHGINMLLENFSKTSYKILNPLKILAMKAPFKCVIASEDGSPSNHFLKKHTNNNNFYTLLNGVDTISSNDLLVNCKEEFQIPDNIPVFLFLSRLSEDKGVLDLLDTLIELKDNLTDFYTIIVGDGICFEEINKLIDYYSLKNILLTGAVKHSEIYKYYQVSDVYISLNRIGNLSNTVLEAVNAGKCIITFEPCNISLRDVSTKQFFNNAAIYINRNNLVSELKDAIMKLVNNPSNILNKKEDVLLCKSQLSSWDKRINIELDLIFNSK